VSLVSKNVVVKSKNGIHFRNAGALAELANNCDHKVSISFSDKHVDAGKALEVILLGAKYGSQVTIQVSGEAPETVFSKVKSILS